MGFDPKKQKQKSLKNWVFPRFMIAETSDSCVKDNHIGSRSLF